MRDYAKVAPKFWTGQTGKDIRKGGSEGVIVALYLMSSPHSNMLGLFYQPLLYMAHETGLGIEGSRKGLQVCIDEGFCAFDEKSEMVWVYEMASYQIANELKDSDLRCKGIQKEYDALPVCPFLGPFFDRYQAAFHLKKRRSSDTPFIAPSKPHRSQEQEQEQEQEQKQEQTHLSLTSDEQAPPASKADDEIEQIFAYWQKTMDSPKSRLDDKRRKAIKGAIAMGYSPRDLCRAIRGCSLTPHNMGENDRGQRYNGIALILRSADQIDRFIANDVAPPRANGHANGVAAHNDALVAAYLARGTSQAPSDPLTVDMEH
ncbi:hypothetical protein ACTJK4_14070 [Ralstonia sp. 22111]|uniref:hypothetical protein n=1 Tax=Ralstonia sp. 22111 TaxID=3453878 RepID=UPI003F8521C6